MYGFTPCPRIKNGGRGQQAEFEQVLLVILVLNKDYCHGPHFSFLHDSDVTYLLLINAFRHKEKSKFTVICTYIKIYSEGTH